MRRPRNPNPHPSTAGSDGVGRRRKLPALLPLLILSMVLLAGCTHEADGKGETTPTAEPEPTASENGTVPTSLTTLTEPSNTTNTTDQTSTTETTDAAEGDFTPDVVHELVMKDAGAGGYAIEPAEIDVAQNDKVRLVIRTDEANLGAHRFFLEGYELSSSTMDPGGEETLNFTANIAGDFAYWCTVGNHRDLGMAGVLHVAGSGT